MNETKLTIRIADYICAYDMNKKVMQAIIEAGNIINRHRKDNEEVDINAVTEELENKYKWKFKL